MEVPPPCCFLMTRGGGGEVNIPSRRSSGGVGGVREVGDFSSRMPGDDCNQFALYAIGWRLDLFSETYTFNCSREERESDQVNLVDRGTVLGDFLLDNVTTFTFICC